MQRKETKINKDSLEKTSKRIDVKMASIILIALTILFILVVAFNVSTNSINSTSNNSQKLNIVNDTSLKLESKEENNVLLIFENDNGIKKLVAPNGLELSAYGSKKVALDYKIEKNTTEYKFETTNMNNEISYNTFIAPSSHIELTKLNFDIELETARDDIRKNLNDNLIASNFIDLNLGDLDNLVSGSVNLREAINSWKTIGAPTWSVTSDGSQIFSYVPGGQTYPNWWGTGLINNNEKALDINSFKMQFTLAQSGQLNEGVCFFVTENSDGSLNGYFFNVNSHKSCYGNPNYYECRLWKFEHYTLNQSFSSGINNNSHMWCYPVSSGYNVGQTSSYGSDSFTCLAKWHGSLTGKYNVEAGEGNIIIKLDDNIVANITDTTYTKGTYGFWGNNCEQRDSMYLKDLSIKTFVISSLEEILNNTTWTANTNNVIINFSDSNEASLNDNTVVDKFKNLGIHYLAVSSQENKSSIEEFIQQIDNNGEFIDSSNYENYINAISNYLSDYFNN